jgi:hypothetical protein
MENILPKYHAGFPIQKNRCVTIYIASAILFDLKNIHAKQTKKKTIMTCNSHLTRLPVFPVFLLLSVI